MVANKDLDFWIDNGYNVLFVGEAGVGKTSMVLDAFNRHDLKWQYYSASTMDPWVDLVGVPKEVQDAKGEPVLDLIKPKQWQEDQVQAVFIDEFNRAHKKVRNAIMELIQFKSINGKRYDNLKIVWAAINPEDSDMDNEYDVEQLDPAQKDRFHFHVKIPYKPVLSYFQGKYGKDLANPAVEWWNKLPREIKKEVSPRRLDYAVDIYSKGGKLDYVLPKNSNISKLTQVLGAATYMSQLLKLESAGDDKELAKWLAKPNNYFNVESYVWSTKEHRKRFVPLLSKEQVATAFSATPAFKKEFARSNDPLIRDAIEHIDTLKKRQVEQNNKKLEGKMKAWPHWKNFAPHNLTKRTPISLMTAELTQAQQFINYSTTQERRRAVRLVLKICPDVNNLTPEVAKAMLDILFEFCVRSQLDTIKTMNNLVPCINYLINYLHHSQGAFDLNAVPIKAKKKLCSIKDFILEK